MKYPWLPEETIESAARELTARAFGNSWPPTPLVDLDAIVFDHLAEVDALSFSNERDLGCEDGSEVLGRMRPLAGKIEISRLLTAPKQTGRYRFTLAHELGHWILHRPLFLAARDELDLFGASSTESGLTSLQRCVFPASSRNPVPPEEWQANRFAVALLVNGDVLREEFGNRFEQGPIARRSAGWRLSRSLREHSRLLASGSARGYAPLHQVFGLSIEATAIALEVRGYAVEDTSLL